MISDYELAAIEFSTSPLSLFRIMIEDHLYWVLSLERWFYQDCDDLVEIFPYTRYPGIPQFLKKPMVKYHGLSLMRRNCHAHGMGRHSQEDVEEMGR